MQSILDAINEWIKEILIGAINGNLSTMFGDVNEKVGTIAAEVGQTPQGWNAGIFSMIQGLSENVIVPIAGLVITYVLCVALVMVSFALGDMTFFGAGDGTESVIGFQAKCYLSSEMPTFQTVARSSLAYTAFFWIVCLVFATIFFTKEYNTGTIKLSVAYGTKRTILYYTKAITILAVSLITYLIFVAAFFVIEIIQSGYIPSASEALTLFGWALACGIVLLAFESISIFLCVIIQNIGVVTGICCLYVFSGASVYLMLWSNMDAASIPLKIFVYGNPMYYWMNFCSCRTMGIIEHLPFYFMGGILLLIVGGIAMSKKEIK